ncbi:hypothetical protein Dimus_016517 [Dionaea muscipula]
MVVKLVGLGALPQPHVLLDWTPDLSPRHYSRNRRSDMLAGFWKKEHNFLKREIDSEIHQFHEQHQCCRVHEIRLQSERANAPRDALPRKQRYKENNYDKKMALIRQKFMELKRLAMDEKCQQSKEFQDALEVLNSHKDLFMTLLQEQNFMFSQHLHPWHSIPPSGGTKRITVLRPILGKSCDKQRKREAKVDLANGSDKHRHGFSPSIPTLKSDDSSSQPTRIVVLKPNLGRVHDLNTVISSAPSSPRNLHRKATSSSTASSPRNLNDLSFLEQLEDDEACEIREVAKEITQQMRANLANLQRDEALSSTVSSNGYAADESSFNKSEAEFAMGNLSSSEVMSPTSRHSCDYVNRHNSTYSSSFSRPSNLAESSVCKEGKKRLSERWAIMTLIGSNQATKLMQRESSTLGEMLALSELKMAERCEYGECLKVQGPRGSTSCISSNLGNGGSIEESPSSLLLRLKSLPVSSMAYSSGKTVEGSVSEVCETVNAKFPDKKKISKLSFTGKVTSLFFPRSNKSSKEKSGKSQPNYQSGAQDAEIPGPSSVAGRTGKEKIRKYSISGLRLPSYSFSPEFDGKLKAGVTSQKAELCLPKSATCGLPAGSQDQPSSTSVLDPPFEEDGNAIMGYSSSIRPSERGKQFPLCIGPSNIIDKSPPIGSIARTLSWDESGSERASCYPSKSPFSSPGIKEEEDEWLFLVQSLLSAAGPDNASRLGSDLGRWHSPDSPLDPVLREKYVDLTINDPLHEAKWRQLRSNHKLVFDYVNTALTDIAGMGSMSSHSCVVNRDSLVDCTTMPKSADGLQALIKECISGGVRCFAGEGECGEEGNSLVEKLVRKEVLGKGWADNRRSEVDNIGREIEGKLLEELVVESITEWTG